MSQIVVIPRSRVGFDALCQICKGHIGGGEEYLVASKIIYHRHCWYKSQNPSPKNPAEKEAHELILGAINKLLNGSYSRETKEHIRRLATRHKRFLD
jgi:hypothetical protein